MDEIFSVRSFLPSSFVIYGFVFALNACSFEWYNKSRPTLTGEMEIKEEENFENSITDREWVCALWVYLAIEWQRQPINSTHGHFMSVCCIGWWSNYTRKSGYWQRLHFNWLRLHIETMTSDEYSFEWLLRCDFMTRPTITFIVSFFARKKYILILSGILFALVGQ